MDKAAIETWAPRSRALDVDGIAWDELRRVPLGAASVRTLRYMQDIESHTVVYVRQLLATRAIDDPDVATFLACWFYEETFHGRALARVLSAAGHAPVARQRSRQAWSSRLEECALRTVSRVWPEFVTVHMTWGAINELTTLTAYQRLVEGWGHPVLRRAAGAHHARRIRHFAFFFAPGRARASRGAAARFPASRALVGASPGLGREAACSPTARWCFPPRTSSAETRVVQRRARIERDHSPAAGFEGRCAGRGVGRACNARRAPDCTATRAGDRAAA